MNFDISQNIILENERSLLRPLVPEDIEHLFPIAIKDKDLMDFSPSEIHRPELIQLYVDTAMSAKVKSIRYPFIIFDKQKNQYAGSTSFGNMSNKNSRLEIGWTWIGKEFQRTGLNRNNKFLMLRYAFEELGCIRVELKTDTRNIQSRTAMKKIGATEEGILRSHTVMSDGYRRDTIYYSILIDEWQGIKETVFKAQL